MKIIGLSCDLKCLNLGLDLIKDFNKDQINIGHLELGKYPVELDKLPEENYKLQRNFIEKLKRIAPLMSTSVHFSSKAKWGHKEKRIRRIWLNEIRGLMEICQYCGVKWINIHLGQKSKKQSREDYLKKASESLREIISWKYNVAISIETSYQSETQEGDEVGIYFDDFWFIHQNVPEIFFTIDIGHNLISGESFWKYLCLLEKGMIISLHCHDNDGFCEHGKRGDPHRAVGEGITNWLEVKRFLGSKNIILIAENRDIIASEISLIKLHEIFIEGRI